MPNDELIIMNAVEQLQRLWAHNVWADAALLAALRATPDHTAAWREYAHVLGAEAVWLARLEQRPATAVWPTLTVAEAEALHHTLTAGYRDYLARLTPASLAETVAYVNSAGRRFDTAVGDILLQVLLHGQYHRGKINLLLRQSGVAPLPVDYIAFVRGVPAATTATDAPSSQRGSDC